MTACWRVGRRNLHSPGAANGRVRNIAVACDLIAGIDHHDPLVKVVRENARDFAQHRRLADAGASEQQNAFARLDQIANDRDRAVHGAPDAAGETDDIAGSIADRGNAVQRALDTGAIVVAERADPVGDVNEILSRDIDIREQDLLVRVPGFGNPAQIEHDLDQTAAMRLSRRSPDRLRNMRRQHRQKI